MSTVSGGRRRAFKSRHHSSMGQWGKPAVIFVSVALLLFVLAVMLGNHLRGLAENVVPETTESESTTEREAYYAVAPEKVIAKGIVFGAVPAPDTTVATDTLEPDAAVSDEVTEAPPEPISFNALSLTLREKDREGGENILAYSSPVSREFSIDRVGSTDLYEGFELIKGSRDEGMKLCGVFEVDYLNHSAETSGVMRAYELALACELVDAGFDEIILLGFTENAEEGIAFISDIYREKGRATAFGLGFTFDYFVSADASTRIDAIAKKCGFLALDLYSAEVPTLMSAEALIADRVSRTLGICREHSIRIILGCGVFPDCEAQTRAALNAGAENVMTVLGAASSEAHEHKENDQ